MFVGMYVLKVDYWFVVLSNGNIVLMFDVVWYVGLFWDMLLCVDLFGYYKFDLQVYFGVCCLFDLLLQEVMFCVVYNYDFKVVCVFGLKIVFIVWLLEYGFGQIQDFVVEQDWDLIVSDLLDLYW